MHRNWLGRLCVLLLLGAMLAAHAAEQPWQQLADCRLVAESANDGDSFHVAWSGHEYIFRLYFVDCPEVDTRFPDRVAEQAAYFGISTDDALRIGRQASTFTHDFLRGRFSVTTRWQNAMGSSKLRREYGLVKANGVDLAESLVANGLARIHGVDVANDEKEIQRLKQLEAQAKAQRRGAWGIGRRPLLPSLRTPGTLHRLSN